MRYLIDGYNLLFRIVHASDDLQTQRKKIIDELSLKMQFLELKGSLIFDAHYQYGEATQITSSHLDVHFTAKGQTADDYILEIIKNDKSPSQLTVITSDKKLSWRARRKLAKSESVEDFIKWLTKRFRTRLRREKQPPRKIEPKPEQLKIKPQLKALPENCFDYYLETFEKRLEDLSKNQPMKTSKGKPRLKSNSKPPSQSLAKPQSDMERWRKAFESENLEE